MSERDSTRGDESKLTILVRGLLRRCPNCGERHIFRGWFAMKPRCPRCGLFFEREEGYWTGAIAINTVATEMVFAVVVGALVIATWPTVPMVPVLAVAIAINGILPFVFYPFSKTLWLASDLARPPLGPGEQREVETLQAIREHQQIVGARPDDEPRGGSPLH